MVRADPRGFEGVQMTCFSCVHYRYALGEMSFCAYFPILPERFPVEPCHEFEREPGSDEEESGQA